MRARTTWPATGAAIFALLVAVGCERDRDRQQVDRTGDPAMTAPAGDERTDTGITTQVQSRFYQEQDLRGRDITVRTNDGIVTLTGTVESEEARRRAVNVAQTVEGVTRVDDRLRVDEARARDEARDDRARATTGQEPRGERQGEDHEVNAGWVTTQINARYFASRDVSPWNVDVTTTSDGVVTLSGTVGSEQGRQEAVRIARETDGVRRVDDRLRIERDGDRGAATNGRDREQRADRDAQADREPREGQPTGTTAPMMSPDAARDQADRQRAAREGRQDGQPVSDTWITTKIQSRFFLDQDVRGRDINVQTHEGVVTLSGEVRTEAEKRHAVALARNTDGVRDVRENLRVVGGEQPRGTTGAGTRERDDRGAGDQARRGGQAVDDTWLTTKIQSQFFLEQQVRGRDVNVTTNNGVVTLRGQVDSDEARRLAETIARETEGVRRVVNELTVGQRATTR
jgi:osmotically-inducible protein OsmY